jgi:dTDP-4-amino-4,6-dideoxygalactose transaminase
MAVLSASLGRGDGTRTVILPTFTFAAGAAAIEWAGYRPLLVDIDAESLQPSLAEAKAAIDADPGRVAGILLCNTFGIGNPEIDDWTDLASDAGIPLLIDSAAGFGSKYSDTRLVGTAGDAEIFSFHATKPFAIGEGGAVFTNDRELAAKLRSFQNFGFEAGHGATTLGLNGKLQEINAAIGIRQLGVISDVVSSRQAVARSYRQRLEPLGVMFPTGIELSSVCFATAVLPTAADRDRALELLAATGIEARVYYSPAIHRQPQFADSLRASDLETAERIGKRVLSLPVHVAMESEIIERISSTVAEAIR